MFAIAKPRKGSDVWSQSKPPVGYKETGNQAMASPTV